MYPFGATNINGLNQERANFPDMYNFNREKDG